MWRASLRAPCRPLRDFLRPVMGTEGARQTNRLMTSSALQQSSGNQHKALKRPNHPLHRFGSSTAAKHQVKNVDRVLSAKQDGLFLHVSWKENGTSRYPFIYLRDNCPCSACRQPDHGRRLFDFAASDVDVSIRPKSVQTSDDGTSVELTWPDGHQSFFDNVWLNDFQLRKGDDHLSSIHFKFPKRWLWTPDDLLTVLPELRFSLDDVMNNPAAAYDWLTKIWTYGIAFLSGAGTTDPKVVKEIAKPMGDLQDTVYGEQYTVIHKPSKANSLGYDLQTKFPLHTDMCFFQGIAGLSLMHALGQADKGGETLFCDGFMVAEKLRRESAEMYDLLLRTEVMFQTMGKDIRTDLDYFVEARHPVIREDETGSVSQICFGTHGRSDRLQLKPELVHDFYRAFCHFGKISMENSLPYRIKPGEICCFDVWRIIHGRGIMDEENALKRVIEGGYVSWDHALSYMRILHKKLHRQH